MAVWEIKQGHVLERLREMPDCSVHCCVCSPPYWGLRSYNTPDQIWGGDSAHEHEWGETLAPHHPGQVEQTKWKSASAAGAGGVASNCRFCSCGAWLGSLGLEPTPELFVEHMVMIFREVRRVLRDDGTLWVNIGDSYSPTGGNREGCSGNGPNTCVGPTADAAMPKTGRTDQRRNLIARNIKPKDLLGIPWMLAFALRADGWYLRQDIIWRKENPMPESVEDRCTRSHEYIFLLSKSAKYFYDKDAIAEPLARPEESQRKTPAKFGGAQKFEEAKKNSRLHSGNEYLGTSTGTRNKRDVWSVASEPYRGAHFATFPTALIEPCVLAGCPVRGTVLDPFSGSGTTGVVALRHGRRYIGIELNPEYITLSRKRLDEDKILKNRPHCSGCGLPMIGSACDCGANAVRWA